MTSSDSLRSSRTHLQCMTSSFAEETHILTYASTRAKKKPSHDFLGAVALAAHLLRFESLHAWAKDELLIYWSSHIKAVRRKPKTHPEEAVDALRLSLDAGIPGIRKRAFYELLRLPDFGQRVGGDSSLRREDCDALVRARHQYTLAWMNVLLKPPQRSAECKQREQKKGQSKCAARNDSCLFPLWLSIVESKNLREYYVDPITGSKTLQDLSDQEQGVCIECELHWESVWEREGQRLWNELDGMLGLPEAAVEGLNDP